MARLAHGFAVGNAVSSAASRAGQILSRLRRLHADPVGGDPRRLKGPTSKDCIEDECAPLFGGRANVTDRPAL